MEEKFICRFSGEVASKLDKVLDDENVHLHWVKTESGDMELFIIK